MRKYIGIVFIVIVGAFSQLSAQAFVSFKEAPKMELRQAKQFFNYKINFNALTKSTIYLELKKGNKSVANGIYDVSKASAKIVNLTITAYKEYDRLEPGTDYSYNLYMYEGERNDWHKKACKTTIIKGVIVR